jgi:hypothetical protein
VLLALGNLTRRLAALEKRLDAREGDRLRLEVLENRNRWLERRLDALDRRGGHRAPQLAPERRVPAVAAARRLGLAPATVRRMVAEGRLEGLAIESGGRRLWTVNLSSLERLERGAPGAPDASEDGFPGAPRAREGG